MTAGSPPDKSDSGAGPWPVEAPALGDQSRRVCHPQGSSGRGPLRPSGGLPPDSTCFPRRPDVGLSRGAPCSGRREGGAAGRGRTARRLRPLRGASRGTGGHRVPARLRALPPRPTPTCPDGVRCRRLEGSPAGQPRVDGSPVRGPPASLSPTTPMARSSPKRLWSWRVPCTVPLGKISRWKPVRQ